jgi:GTPase SAR1 family protein
MITIVIIGGLPASGKTTLAHEYKQCQISSIDNYIGQSEIEILTKIKRDFGSFYVHNKHRTNFSNYKFIVEGLFTMNNHVQKLLDYISTETTFNIIDTVEIVWFEENRPQCIVNDSYRVGRDKKSNNTILNSPYESIDLSLFDNKRFKINLIEKKVFVMKDWQKFANKYDVSLTSEPTYYYTKNVGDIKFLVGNDTWEKYGTYNSCWGHVRDVEEENPTEFTELNDLLEKCVPNITFLQYKKLEYVVFEREIDMGDYYSTVTGGCNVCDIENLYDTLVELELFDPLTLEDEI